VSIHFAGKSIEIEYHRSQNGKSVLIKKGEVNRHEREVSATELTIKQEDIADWSEKTKIAVFLQDRKRKSNGG
jgi:hypothetical protein